MGSGHRLGKSEASTFILRDPGSPGLPKLASLKDNPGCCSQHRRKEEGTGNDPAASRVGQVPGASVRPGEGCWRLVHCRLHPQFPWREERTA